MRVIVIGGGIVGASAAYHLSTLGVETMLVDRADAGQATVAGSGLVFPGPIPVSPPTAREFEVAASKYYPELMRKLAFDGIAEAGYSRVGLITVAEAGEACDAAYEQARWLADQPDTNAGEVTRLAVGEPAARVSVLASNMAGVWVSGFARVDGKRLRDAMLTAALERGARRAPAGVELNVRGSAVTGVRLGRESVAADAVVVAAGAWSAEVCKAAGVEIGVRPNRGQAVRLGVEGVDTEAWPVIGTPDLQFVVGMPGGRVATPGTVEPGAGFASMPTAAGLRENLDRTLEIAPGLAAATLEELRVGFRPESIDGAPLLGAVDDVPGLYVATGLGANGLSFGPYAGCAIAELVLGHEVPFDASGLLPDRLQEDTVDGNGESEADDVDGVGVTASDDPESPVGAASAGGAADQANEAHDADEGAAASSSESP